MPSRRTSAARRVHVKVVRLYTSCLSHSTSFASALPRWEILFFSTLGISAYVWPSYSKHASQPKKDRVSLCLAMGRGKRSSYRNQWAHEQLRFYPTLAVSTLCCPGMSPSGTYRSSALEDNGLMARTFTVCECADCLSGLVVKACKQFVELLYAEGLEEPFSERQFMLATGRYTQELRR